MPIASSKTKNSLDREDPTSLNSTRPGPFADPRLPLRGPSFQIAMRLQRAARRRADG
jgi:hypothetical protein